MSLKPYQGKYIIGNERPYKISRSKIENFIKCPRCFYLDRRLKIGQPSGPPFTINSAVDNLLKNEFDRYRAIQEPHPYMIRLGLNAVPFQHEKLDDWRENFKGVSYIDMNHNFHLHGAVDDIWQDTKTGELIVVEYKATSKSAEITLDADWQFSYKRQIEIYQFLLRQNGFEVSNTSYFVYCNGIRDKSAFDECMEFQVSLIPYVGDDSWLQDALSNIYDTLNQDKIPGYTEECAYCEYQRKLDTLI
ncbi:PD-(D/E)XK nuclease family protein [Robiginitalea aurantiaca]|uniref:PD-(D/E)XK nuclease family protein n=1 Tax=Robiginitalea aurantiaca TaxID=3056915 RepID=A0ABT7WBF3_9FLAO|nr:PD-(D/E)XK nuclease family protein [Robiginitalea aurantiaca]MDM9630242.1 PD-(D/E)XK nuclease family protein [Robiginitalea aurantiaca]